MSLPYLTNCDPGYETPERAPEEDAPTFDPGRLLDLMAALRASLKLTSREQDRSDLEGLRP